MTKRRPDFVRMDAPLPMRLNRTEQTAIASAARHQLTRATDFICHALHERRRGDAAPFWPRYALDAAADALALHILTGRIDAAAARRHARNQTARFIPLDD
jgi:hypothetical protein